MAKQQGMTLVEVLVTLVLTPKVDAPKPSTKKDSTPINPIPEMEDEK